MIHLAVRADDAGSSLSANKAIEECVNAGLVRNVSIMVPGPFFDDAVQRFAGRKDICVGLHITLSAEWVTTKWGPILPRERVSSLLDANGQFTPSPQALLTRGFVLEEASDEIEAQLVTARNAGLNIAYIDEHMNVGRIGLRPFISNLCQREGILHAHNIKTLSLGTSLVSARARLSETSPGNYVWVTHPGYDALDMSGLHVEGQANDGSVARERDAERRLLVNPELPSTLELNSVKACSYMKLLS